MSEEAVKPRVIVIVGDHNPFSASLARRLMMLTAMQVIILTQAEENTPSLEDLTLRIVERQPIEMPVIMVAPREIRHDYNLRAGYEPRRKDHAMMQKSHDAQSRKATKSARYRHFHY